MNDTCPSCQSDLTGEPIPPEHFIHADDCPKITGAERCYCLPYGDDHTHFSRLIGVEVRGIYDGVLYWLCPDCNHAWPRMTDGGWGARLVKESSGHAAMHNAGVTA